MARRALRARGRRALAVGVVVGMALAAMAGLALADALGPHFRVSFQGHDGDSSYKAFFGDVAYDPQTGNHLTVFIDQDPAGYSVVGQLVDENGAQIGANFPISSGTADPDGAREPASVNYNATNDEFIVTWYTYHGDRNSDAGPRGAIASGPGTVYAQRVSAAGALLGSNVAVSTFNYGDIETTDAAWSPEGNEYLVAWKDAQPGQSDLGQVYGRLLNPDGTPKGSDQLQITHFPTSSGQGADDAMALVYNSRDHEFAAVVRAYDGGQAPGEEAEIYGQRVGLDGADVGPSDFRISNVAPTGDSSPDDANTPAIAYNPNADQYLVGWSTDTGTDNGAQQVWAQRVAADGTLVGDPLQVSDVGSDSSAYRPDLAYDPPADQYLATFHAGPDKSHLAIYGDIVSGAGGLLGARDFPISDMGADHNEQRPAADYDTRTCDFRTVWSGNAAEGDLSSGQTEVWGRRVSAPPCPAPNAITDPASGVAFTSGTLNGRENLEWQPGSWHFEWGTTTGYGSSTPTQPAPADGSDHPQAAGLSGLSAGTTYHYRIVATTAKGVTAVGADQTFTTPAPVQSRRPARGRISIAGVRIRGCTRSGVIHLRVRVRSASRVRSLTVSLDGRRIATRRSGRADVRIRAKRLSMRRHRLTITTRNAAGTTRRTVTFRRCAARIPRFTG